MPIPFVAAIAASKVFKTTAGFFSAITLRQWLFVLATVAILFTGYKGYNWVYDRGSDSRQAEIDQLIGDLAAERAKISQWEADTKLANETFKKEQEGLRATLQVELDAANERAKNRKVDIREIPKYITITDDSKCDIPVNFGILHNQSIEGTGTGDQLSESAPGVQGATSSVTLSQYTAVSSANNSEAVRRGEIIQQWEKWYDETKAQFDRAQQSASQAVAPPPTTE